MIYPWHESAWRQLAAQWGNRPNAWLLTGRRDTGKTAFARHLAQALLCEQPQAEHQPCGSCPSCQLSRRNTPTKRTYRPEVFMRAARYVYRKGRFDRKMLSDAPVVAAIRETYECLQPSLDHISHSTPQVVRDALDNNAFVFSGFKTYHTMRELGLSLTKDDGSIKPFDEFYEEVKAIHDSYNVRYLESEYDHAVGSALMADRWHSSAPKSWGGAAGPSRPRREGRELWAGWDSPGS